MNTLFIMPAGNNIAPESLPMLVVGVIMLVIAIVLITGFLLFKVNRIKSATKSRYSLHVFMSIVDLNIVRFIFRINQIPLHRNKIHTMVLYNS